MTGKEFLENKNIKEPTYEGVRLVDNEMRAYRIVELLEEYHQAKLKLLGIANVSVSLLERAADLVGNPATKFKQADKRLDEVDFYNLMQAYRHTPMTEQEKTIERYEAVKDWIKQNYS